MHRALIFFVLIAVFSNPVQAACDVTGHDLSALKQLEDGFRQNPSKTSASLFFDKLPRRYCEFQKIYGWSEETEGPLYSQPLHVSLEALAEFITPEALANTYVALASQARWQADNVSALQSAYLQLFEDHPGLIVDKIMALSAERKKNAITFLFDGPHPSGSFLTPSEKQKICRISADFCKILQSVEQTLRQQEEIH